MRRRFLAVLAAGLLAAPVVPGAARAEPSYPFRDPALPLQARVDDLVGRLTLDEKVAMLHQFQPAVPRLGVGFFKTGTEALHGVAWSTDIDNGGAVVTADGTSFPQAVGLASTWDPDLIKRVGAVVGDEARGFYARDPRVFGLNLWAPVVNLLRDPRWGRNEEGYSEDPYLTGAISTAYGKGLQGPDPAHLKTAPTLKHYLAYNNEKGRDVTSSNVPPRVLNEYDRAAFKPALTADAATGVMASYNLVNGRPTTVDPDHAGLLRDWSDYPLFNVSDAWAPANLTGSQGYFATQAEANAALLKAGLDSFTVNDTNGAPTVAAVKEALARGLLTEGDVDKAVGHALSIRFRLGEFDPGGGPYGGIDASVINAPAHKALAREAAGDAMVLLKNARGTLPLKPGGTVAVVGPLSDTLYTDWYGGKLPYEVTAVDGIASRSTVRAGSGADRIALKQVATGRYLTANGTGLATVTGAAPDAAAQFDAVDWGQDVLTLRNVATGRYLGSFDGSFGTRDEQPGGWFVQQQFKIEPQADGSVVLRYAGYETTESWFGPNVYVTAGPDGRLTLGSPDAAGATRFTREVLRSGIEDAVAAASAAQTAVVVVGTQPMINGREAHDRTGLSLGDAQIALVRAVVKANPRTVVVLQTSYPVTGLPEDVPSVVWTTHAGAETGNALADVLFGDRDPAGRLTQTWPRSVSQLPADLGEYDIISSRQTYQYSPDRPLYPFGFGLSYTSFAYGPLSVGDGRVRVTVRNTGKRAGSETVQLYTHQRSSRDPVAVKQLRGFQRVTLGPGQAKTVTLPLPASALARWDQTRSRWIVESSTYDVLAGSSSADIRARGVLRVAGSVIPPRALSAVRAETFDAYEGVRLLDETKAAGTVVGAVADGQWAAYKDADLRGVTSFTARVASPGPGTIQIRSGSPTGRLLGTAPVAATGGVYEYADVRAALTRTSGRHDVYLVLSAGVRLAEFALR
ncbi:glycoside hydrolase family 3 C-terminal domain-containing protein [Actinoplanes sp. LDG1-06]|uniref:Glycoside hydrolase family 3 C-terminal domain-containing protein n=1 Tax=Paractinoplanes ovalisporus TaxID=2810368 RepID=A0ABS2AM07_9ACTN|nr:glycoside hydrolase family 3 protein [Actinoplanes ovalisporus]MBM2620239.1 glycoside hydrolase family 3 C-terminal domain-containing protein [Actinoplanes ovalisporus]